MEVLEQGRIKVIGADCLGETAELEISQESGRHGRMKATVWLRSEEEGRETEWEEIGICVMSVGTENIPLFSGRIRHACVCRIKGQPAVRLEADSYTVQLDQKKKNRSFQKESRTYWEMVRELLVPYNGSCIWRGGGENTQIGRLLMQYKETDWQFLCRVASLQGHAVIPEVRFPGAKLYIGVSETRTARTLEADAWRVRKSLAKTPDVTDNGREGVLSGGTEIIVEERYEDFGMGDTVLFHGERLIITGKISRFAGNQWVHDYALRKETECHMDRICNPELSGAAVKGTVLETTLTSSRLALVTDGAGEEPESLHIQPVYYAGGGKGYSGQPEKGDTQYLYFPTMREEDRYIIGGADAGKERIDALVEAEDQERREEEEQGQAFADVKGNVTEVGSMMAGIIRPRLERHVSGREVIPPRQRIRPLPKTGAHREGGSWYWEKTGSVSLTEEWAGQKRSPVGSQCLRTGSQSGVTET